MPDQAKMARAVFRSMSAQELESQRDDFMGRVSLAGAAGFDPEARKAYVDKYGSVSLTAFSNMSEEERNDLVGRYDGAVKEKRQLVTEAAMHVLKKRKEAGKEVKENILVEQLSQIEDPLDVINYIAGATGEGLAQIPAALLTGGMSSFIVEAGEIYTDQLEQIQKEKSNGP